MVSKDLIAYLKLAHGFFNISMLALFCWQGWMGYLIRQARTADAPLPLDAVRRHRRAGPVFAFWGALGFAAGCIVILLDKGRVLEYPLHFLGGSAVTLCIAAVYAASRGISGNEALPRDRHFRLGLLLLALYIVQVFFGLAILL